MTQPSFRPSRIRTPFQLLAVYFATLIILIGVFLTFALKIDSPSWIRCTLVLVSVLLVPLFVGVVYRLQTKFRFLQMADAELLDFIKARLDSELGKQQREIERLHMVLAQSSPQAVAEQEAADLQTQLGLTREKHRNALEAIAESARGMEQSLLLIAERLTLEIERRGLTSSALCELTDRLHRAVVGIGKIVNAIDTYRAELP